MSSVPTPPMPTERRVDDLDDPFWQGCREGRLMVQTCERCGRSYFPASSCVEHGPAAMRWRDASGRGAIVSYVIVHRTHELAFQASVPYNAAIIRLAEGVLFHSSIVDCAPGELAVGRAVAAVFDEMSPGETLPRFALVRQPAH